MVRPINADAVYKILESCEIKKDTYGSLLNDWDHGYNCGIERSESEIECAPTIDAIPIEWLTAQAENPSNSDAIRNAIDYIVYKLWAERRQKE